MQIHNFIKVIFVKYKENLNHLGVIKFNISTLCNQNLIPLGVLKLRI